MHRQKKCKHNFRATIKSMREKEKKTAHRTTAKWIFGIHAATKTAHCSSSLWDFYLCISINGIPSLNKRLVWIIILILSEMTLNKKRNDWENCNVFAKRFLFCSTHNSQTIHLYRVAAPRHIVDGSISTERREQQRTMGGHWPFLILNQLVVIRLW